MPFTLRIPRHIAVYFPSLVGDGDLGYIFDGVKQPETYAAQLPNFDFPDPNYVDDINTAQTIAVPPDDETSSSSTHTPTASSAAHG